MSYYDPYNNRSSYYDPSSYTNRQETNIYNNVSQSAASFVTNMVGYLAVAAVGSAAMSAISRGIGAGTKHLAVKHAPKSAFATKLTAKAKPTFNDVIRSTERGAAASRKLESTIRPYKRAYQQRKVELKNLRQTDPIAASQQRISSIFKDEKTFIGSVGNLAARHTIKGSVSSYVYDNLTGNIAYYDLESKKAYDIPGHAGNYLQYMQKNALAFSFFGMVGPALSSVKGAAGSAVRNTFAANPNLTNKSIEFLSRMSKPNFRSASSRYFNKQVQEFQSKHEANFVARSIASLKGGIGATYETMRHGLNRNLNHVIGNEADRTINRNAARGTTGPNNDSINRTISEFTEIFKARRDSALEGRLTGEQTYSGTSILKTIDSINTPLDFSSQSNDGVALLQSTIGYNKYHKSNSFVASILGLEQSRIGDIVDHKFVSNIAKRVSDKNVNNQQLLESTLSNLYFDKNVFQRDGKFVDLGIIDPIQKVKSLASAIGRFEVPVPIMNNSFEIGKFTGLNALGSQRIHATTYNKSVTGLEQIVQSKENRLTSNSGKPYRNRTIGEMAAAALNRDSVNTSDVSVTYVSGRFFAHDGINFKKLDTRLTMLRTSDGINNEYNTAAFNRYLYDNAKESKAAQQLDRIDKAFDKTDYNPVSYMMQKLDWGAPQWAMHSWRRIKGTLAGSTTTTTGRKVNVTEQAYTQAIEGMYGVDLHHDRYHEHLPKLRDMLRHAEQIISPLMRDSEVFAEMAHKSKGYLNKRDFELMHNDQKFIDVLRSVGDSGDIKDMLNTPTLRKLYNRVINNPTETGYSRLARANGRLSELTEIDSLRTSKVVHDVVRSWNGEGPHPMIDAADSLFGRGLISKNEQNAIKTYSAIDNIFRNTRPSNFTNPNSSTQKMTSSVMNKYKATHNSVLSDVINFVADNEIKPTFERDSIRLAQSMTSNLFAKSSLEHHLLTNTSPYISIGIDKYAGNNYGAAAGNILDVSSQRFTNLISQMTGLKREPLKYGNGIGGAVKFASTRTLQIAGASLAYKTLDAVVADSHIFEETALNNGISGFVADNVAKSHLTLARFTNTVGLSQSARYLEGLMPGFTSTLPGGVIGGATGYMMGGKLGLLKGTVRGAINNRLLSPFMPDMTKTYQQLEAEYSGEADVPIIDGKTWFLGTTPWQGKTTVGWQPNWYNRTKSRWKSTDTLYGSNLRQVLHEPIFPLGMSIGDIVDPYYMERCVAKNTKVITKNGYVKLIQDIIPGDNIMSHDGKHHKVLNTWTKEINEDIIVIDTALSNIPAKTTIEHRYLVLKTNQYTKRKDRVSYCTNKSWCKCIGCNTQYYKEYKPEWIRADELKPGDYICYPKLKIPANNDVIRIHNQDKYNSKNIPKCINKTEDLFRLFGYYLAEGHSSNRSVIFDFHSKEITHHNDVISIIKTIFNIDCTTYIDNNKTRIVCSNAILARFFKVFGNDYYSKSIPSTIYNSNKTLLTELIKGFIRGDGCNTLDISVSMISVSEQLISQLRSILNYLDFVPSYYFDSNRKENEADAHILYIHGEQANILRSLIGSKINKKANPSKYYFKDDNFIYIKIKDVYTEYYNDTIYDIEIDKSHSFIGITHTFHNSHYFTRPYPETGDFGDEIPLGIGPIFGGTIGRFIKPKKQMHQEFLNGHSPRSEVSAISPPTLGESYDVMQSSVMNPNSTAAVSRFGGTHRYANSKMYAHSMAERSIRKMEHTLGFIGFQAGNIRTGLYPERVTIPTLETAGRISSMARSYNDMHLGGLGMGTELPRRFIEKPDHKVYGVNPIPNTMPNWLPERFRTGDPYASITRGELRLPGAAYSKTRSAVLQHDLPADSILLGLPTKHIIQYYSGSLSMDLKEEYGLLEKDNYIKESVQNWLRAEGLLEKANSLVFDTKRNISGKIDGIVHDGTGGGGRRALEIKAVSDTQFQDMSKPLNEHVSQLNFYMHNLGLEEGVLLYTSRDNPSNLKTYHVKYDETKLDKDIAKLEKARNTTSQMMVRGKIKEGYGETYSWVDRLLILSDVAPHSEEYQEAKRIVDIQRSNNLLSNSDISKYYRAKKQREAVIRKYDLYPLRFKGKVMSPSYHENIQSTNENIKAAAEYSLPERIVGAGWETFTNLNTPIINKLWHYKDPLEHYKLLHLYGKEYTPWTDPYGSFIEPKLNYAFAQESALGGAVTWGVHGIPYLFGGRPAAFAGALAGGIYGAAHGAYRNRMGGAYIPGKIESERLVNDYFDELKYERYKRMSLLSDGTEQVRYADMSKGTLTHLLSHGGSGSEFFKAVGNREKPYLSAFLDETDHRRREEIARSLPSNVSSVMKSYWEQSDMRFGEEGRINATSANSSGPKTATPYTMRELDPSIVLDDIKLKTINKEGLHGHDFGLGWQEQLIRMQNTEADIYASNIHAEQIEVEHFDVGAVKSALMSLFNNQGVRARVNVYNNNYSNNDNIVYLTVQRDRTADIRQAITFREELGYD